MRHVESLEGRSLFSVNLLGNGDLFIDGSAGPDKTRLLREGNSPTLYVTHNGQTKSFALASVRKIVWHGRGGNDTLYSAYRNITTPIHAFGGPGNDNVGGNKGNDVLYGGDSPDSPTPGADPRNDGNDGIQGVEGNDLLVGGTGRDQLVAGSGTDTVYDGPGLDLIDTDVDHGVVDTIYHFAESGVRDQIRKDAADRVVRTSLAQPARPSGPKAVAGAILLVDRAMGPGQEAAMQKNTFYPAWYLAKYPDVARAVGAGNLDGATRHWIDNGINESRMPNPHFHALAYLARYDDLLAAFGYNRAAATKHWVNDGIREGRDASPGLVQGRTAANVRLRSSASLLALDADANTSGLGGRVQVYQSHGASNQRWDLAAQSDGTYVIYSRASGLVLDADFHTLGSNGTRVHMWAYNGGRHQHWRLEATIDGSYVIRNAASGRALDVEATQQGTNGGRMQLWDYIGGANQRWRIA